MIAGYKKHVGFYPYPTTIEHFRNELRDCKKGRGSKPFPLNGPILRDLVIEMVEYRKRLLDTEYG